MRECIECKQSFHYIDINHAGICRHCCNKFKSIANAFKAIGYIGALHFYIQSVRRCSEIDILAANRYLESNSL